MSSRLEDLNESLSEGPPDYQDFAAEAYAEVAYALSDPTERAWLQNNLESICEWMSYVFARAALDKVLSLNDATFFSDLALKSKGFSKLHLGFAAAFLGEKKGFDTATDAIREESRASEKLSMVDFTIEALVTENSEDSKNRLLDFLQTVMLNEAQKEKANRYLRDWSHSRGAY